MTALKHYIVSAILAIVMMQVATIWATPNHPFWTGAQYTIADSLHAGDRLYGADGGNIFIQDIIRKDTSAEVYNFAVEDNENYYVGQSSVLVHNSNCFLKNIENLDILSANLNNLSPLLKKQFLQDFENAGSELLEVLNKPNGVKAWEKLIERPKWVRLNTDLLAKIADKGDDFMSRVNLFYKNFSPSGPFPDVRLGINFNKYGFPDFSSYHPPITNKKYFSENLVGNGQNTPDYADAANWFVANNPNASLANGGKGIVVDGQYYAMHHMEDGKTIMPVLGTKHSEVGHTGGGSIIDKGLKGLFEIP